MCHKNIRLAAKTYCYQTDTYIQMIPNLYTILYIEIPSTIQSTCEERKFYTWNRLTVRISGIYQTKIRNATNAKHLRGKKFTPSIKSFYMPHVIDNDNILSIFLFDTILNQLMSSIN